MGGSRRSTTNKINSQRMQLLNQQLRVTVQGQQQMSSSNANQANMMASGSSSHGAGASASGQNTAQQALDRELAHQLMMSGDGSDSNPGLSNSGAGSNVSGNLSMQHQDRSGQSNSSGTPSGSNNAMSSGNGNNQGGPSQNNGGNGASNNSYNGYSPSGTR